MQTASTNINFRVQPEVRDRIDRAALIVNKSRTDFILEASCKEANHVLLDRAFFAVSAAQLAEYETIMARPIEANAAVMKLLAKKAPWES